MAGGRDSSNSSYGALNTTRFLPARFRRREELVLQTYDEGNDPLEVGDDGAACLSRSSTMVGAASSGTPAPRSAPMAVVQAGAPPSSAESAREALARRIDGGGLLGGGSSVLG
jgi:hypothetical protein